MHGAAHTYGLTDISPSHCSHSHVMFMSFMSSVLWQSLGHVSHVTFKLEGASSAIPVSVDWTDWVIRFGIENYLVILLITD